MDVGAFFAGVVALGVAVLASVVLVFVTYRLSSFVARQSDADALLRSGNRSVGLALGATILSQAMLLRHAVFPVMAVIRDVFVQPFSIGYLAWALAFSVACFAILGVLSFVSVVLATWLFQKLTRSLPEREEILRDNVAVGILFAFVVVAITLIVSEGIEDFSRSIIPFPESGVLRVEPE